MLKDEWKITLFKLGSIFYNHMIEEYFILSKVNWNKELITINLISLNDGNRYTENLEGVRPVGNSNDFIKYSDLQKMLDETDIESGVTAKREFCERFVFVGMFNELIFDKGQRL